MVVCTREWEGMTAVLQAGVLVATPCTKSLGGGSGGRKHRGGEGRKLCPGERHLAGKLLMMAERADAVLVRLLLLVGFVAIMPCAAETAHVPTQETFEEDLLLRPLPDGNILTHFSLRTTWAAHSAQHYGMFPKVIGEMMDAYGVGEVHVTFGRGQWVGQRWGSAPVAAPQGVELWAWFADGLGLGAGSVRPRGPSELQQAWRGLTNALAGMMGASLNTLAAETQHVHPKRSVRPRSGLLRALWGEDSPESHVFLGSLPREVACTENLTPWGKLLPCRQRAGLAALLRADRSCRGLYSSYSMHVTVECKNPSAAGKCSPADIELVLVQTATVVHGAGVISSQMSREGLSQRISPAGVAEFSLSWLLPDTREHQFLMRCPLASASWIHVHVPEMYREPRAFALNITRPATHSPLQQQRRQLSGSQGELVSLEIGRDIPQALDISLRWSVLAPAALSAGMGTSMVSVHRVLASHRTASGRGDGTLVLDISNHHPQAALTVLVHDRLVRFAGVFLGLFAGCAWRVRACAVYGRRAKLVHVDIFVCICEVDACQSAIDKARTVTAPLLPPPRAHTQRETH